MIELLVVVTIIAILASMLLPALSGARDRAKTIACLGQVRQQAGAAFLYAGDADDIMPLFLSNGQYSAYHLLMAGGYLGRDRYVAGAVVNEILLCPAEETTSTSDMGGPPRLEVANEPGTFANGYSALINTRAGLSARYRSGFAVEPLWTHYDWNSAHPAWWGLYGGAQLPLGTDDPSAPARRVTLATRPDNTWLCADNQHPDMSLREVLFPHIGLNRNYMHLDGHGATLGVSDLDGGPWGAWHHVVEPRFGMNQ